MKYVEYEGTTCPQCHADLFIYEVEGERAFLFKYGCCGIERLHRYIVIGRSQIMARSPK